MTEPWLRGTLSDVPVVHRALLHSLEMAQEDTAKWCRDLDDRELHARPFNLPSVAFQLRHIARSLDRFCAYAEGTPLTPAQFKALASEMDASGTRGIHLQRTGRKPESDTPASGRDRPPAT